ncbi:MAG: RDD family protein [Chitinophagales bacterium]|nr:RDD family protein [Chitinophagales bacterium]
MDELMEYDASHQMASVGKRFINFIIDLSVFYFLFHLLMGGKLSFIDESDPTSKIGLRLVTAFFLVLYYFILEGIFGTTIGKLITQTRLVDEEGNKPPLLNILIRSLSRIVPFESLSFFWSDNGWHDKWSNTYVVEKSSLK